MAMIIPFGVIMKMCRCFVNKMAKDLLVNPYLVASIFENPFQLWPHSLSFCDLLSAYLLPRNGNSMRLSWSLFPWGYPISIFEGPQWCKVSCKWHRTPWQPRKICFHPAEMATVELWISLCFVCLLQCFPKNRWEKVKYLAQHIGEPHVLPPMMGDDGDESEDWTSTWPNSLDSGSNRRKVKLVCSTWITGDVDNMSDSRASRAESFWTQPQWLM